MIFGQFPTLLVLLPHPGNFDALQHFPPAGASRLIPLKGPRMAFPTNLSISSDRKDFANGSTNYANAV
jgi:hypothetical protein